MRVRLTLPADGGVLSAALEGLVAANAVILARAGTVRRLYASGVRYQRERGTEDWRTIPQVLRAGRGDCEDLAAWRAAELRVYDAEPARAIVRRSGPKTLHAVVVRADGRIEDPARRLGMKGRG